MVIIVKIIAFQIWTCGWRRTKHRWWRARSSST